MSSQLTGKDGSWVTAQPRVEPSTTTPAQDRRFYDRTRPVGRGALAALVALAVSAVDLVLNELTDQSLVVFRYIAVVGPVSVSLLGYALTPAPLAGVRSAGSAWSGP